MKTPLLLLAFLTAFSCFAEVRTWTSNDGRTLEGEYISSSKEQVTILSKGKERKLKIVNLAEEDQEYIKKYKEKASKSGSALKNHNFDDRWPSSTVMEDKIKAKLVSEENGQFIYETTHFRFYTTVKLTLDTISTIGRVFEGTYTLNKMIPLNFACRRFESLAEVEEGESSKGAKAEMEEKLVARLFETKAAYDTYLSGKGINMPNSAGLFDGREVLVPFESLGIVKKGKNYAFESKRDLDVGTLIHEITHQMTLYSGGKGNGGGGFSMQLTPAEKQLYDSTGEIPERYKQNRQFSPSSLPIWFAEGIAEYAKVAPYSNGRFAVSRIDGAMKGFIVGGAKSSRRLGKNPKLPHLKNFMEMSTKEFQSADMSTSQIYYGYSAMIFYYFANLDGKGDAARFKRWMQGAQNGQHETTDYSRLLDGRDWDKLEKDFAKAMKSKLGISIEWQ